MLDGANTSALLLAQAVPSFSRSELRWELANIAAEVPPARFANTLLDSVAVFSGYNSARAQENDITLIVLDFQ